ncbi:hypothetical protein SLA2020_390610 [Shorea laevis]
MDFLKTDSGAWISDRASIGAAFVDHFSTLFSSSVSPIEDEMLNLFEPSISAEENDLLCSLPTEDEIFQALSSLGSTKAPGPTDLLPCFIKNTGLQSSMIFWIMSGISFQNNRY